MTPSVTQIRLHTILSSFMEVDLTKDEMQCKIDKRFMLFEHISQEQTKQTKQTNENDIYERDTTTAFVAFTPQQFLYNTRLKFER